MYLFVAITTTKSKQKATIVFLNLHKAPMWRLESTSSIDRNGGCLNIYAVYPLSYSLIGQCFVTGSKNRRVFAIVLVSRRNVHIFGYWTSPFIYCVGLYFVLVFREILVCRYGDEGFSNYKVLTFPLNWFGNEGIQ